MKKNNQLYPMKWMILNQVLSSCPAAQVAKRLDDSTVTELPQVGLHDDRGYVALNTDNASKICAHLI